ncbi:MAG TPA: hypothetical protein VFD91_17620 [Mariniphaga sp.]|nr:hypothetical protein [Mariniphaga sp.]
MNLIKKITLVVIIVISFFACCESKNANCDYLLTFTNNTNKTLKVYRSHHYPDTTAIFSGWSTVYLAKPNSTVEISAGKISCKQLDCWEPLFGSSKYGGIPSGVLMIGVVDQNDIDTYGIEEVKSNYMLLKRYDLTLQDLKDMNWQIVFSE